MSTLAPLLLDPRDVLLDGLENLLRKPWPMPAANKSMALLDLSDAIALLDLTRESSIPSGEIAEAMQAVTSGRLYVGAAFRVGYTPMTEATYTDELRQAICAVCATLLHAELSKTYDPERHGLGMMRRYLRTKLGSAVVKRWF